MADIAATNSQVLGRDVRQQIPFDGFEAWPLERGMSESFAQGYVDTVRAEDEGIDNAAARTSSSAAPTASRQPPVGRTGVVLRKGDA